MATGRGVPLVLLAVLALQGSGAVKVGHVLMQTEFYQRDETRNKEGGQFMFDFDGDEIFHVDLEKSETIWRLPIFTTFTSFEAQGALQNIAVDKQNMEIMMKRSNRSQGTIAPPEVTVFSETLVCALGLAVGIVGIVVGTILIIKAMKMNNARNQRGLL